jgi:hypothetical protein
MNYSELPVNREQSRSFLASRLVVTYLDRDMDFVWTLKHLDKTSWQRSSSVQIKPPQPKNLLPSISSANPATIRIDNFEFQSNASERTADDKYNRNSFRIARQPHMVPFNRNLIGGLPTN